MIRNLLYHVYPRIDGQGWLWNIEELSKRKNLFNGKKVIGIAVDGLTEHPQKVENIFRENGWRDCQFFAVGNNRNLREVQTFETLFDAVESIDPEQVTFYAHSKGVTWWDPNNAVHHWVRIMYEVNLDYWPYVEKILLDYSTAGAFKRFGWWQFPPNSTKGTWMYFGSFWWFRNKDLFEKDDWRRIDRMWCGIEPYNSIHFPEEKAFCLFHSGWAHQVDPYRMDYIQNIVYPDLEKFRKEFVEYRKEWPDTE